MRKRTIKNRIRLWFSKRTNRRLCLSFFSVLGVCLLVVALLFALLQVPRLLVHPVVLATDSDVTEVVRSQVFAELEKELFGGTFLLPGETRYLFAIGTLERHLQALFPSLKEIDIRVHLFGDWELYVAQRIPFGTHCLHDRCVIIDTEGTVVQETYTGSIGLELHSEDALLLGTHVFGMVEHGTIAISRKNFTKLREVLKKLEEVGAPVASLSVRAGSYDVYLVLENGIGVWVDTTESVAAITKALHAVFVGVFQDEGTREEIRSIVICDPHNILWTAEAPWLQGCRERSYSATTE